MGKEKILIDESDIEERYKKGLYEDYLKEKINNLQQRIDKAIEYIENKEVIINTDKIRIFDLFETEKQGYIDKLSRILKGDNNDWFNIITNTIFYSNHNRTYQIL